MHSVFTVRVCGQRCWQLIQSWVGCASSSAACFCAMDSSALQCLCVHVRKSAHVGGLQRSPSISPSEDPPSLSPDKIYTPRYTNAVLISIPLSSEHPDLNLPPNGSIYTTIISTSSSQTSGMHSSQMRCRQHSVYYGWYVRKEAFLETIWSHHALFPHKASLLPASTAVPQLTSHPPAQLKFKNPPYSPPVALSLIVLN